MMQQGVRVRKASGLRCWGVGLVAMDIVATDHGNCAATGGSCGNVMAILAWLGWTATPIARLGDDVAGTFVRDELKDVRVDTRHLSREASVSTPIVIQRFVTANDGSQTHRFSLTCPECGAWLPRYRPITLRQADALNQSAQQPRAFYFDRVSPGALHLASVARDRGALVVFEPASIGDEKKFQRAVDLCHVLKYSQDRLGHVPDLAIAAAPKLIVETQGELGLRFRWRSHWTHLGPFDVDSVVDAAGSGDWCSAALIHEIGSHGATGLSTLRKEELIAALRTGQALASINCRYYGARGAMLAMDFRQLNSRLDQLTRPADEQLPGIEEATLGGVAPPEYCRQCDPTVAGADNAMGPIERRA